MPWKRSPIVVAAAVATTALAAPGPAVATEFAGAARTPIHRFARNGEQEAPAATIDTTDDVVTAEQIRELNELLAIPTGPELDVQLRDWP
jgi:hypothetical protein